MKPAVYTVALALICCQASLAMAQQEQIQEGAASTMGVVGMSPRRIVLFSAEQPDARPKLIIYQRIPKPGEISDLPLLIPQFIPPASAAKNESAVAPAAVIMEESRQRRTIDEPGPNGNANDDNIDY